MKKEGSLLIVDDNRGILSALSLLLSRYFEQVITIDSPNLIDSSLRSNRFDVVLLDMNFTASVNNGNEGLYWLSKIKERSPDIQVVVFTAYADIDLAVEAIKKGATDFVVKPWDNGKLIASLQNAYNLGKSKRDVKHLKEIRRELVTESPMFWGKSAAMKELQSTIRKVAATDAAILLTGENGTGKEMLAKEIHNLSKRQNELLITVDMGAIAETLFESELFGHVKGAFTDANADRAGKFEVAHRGTLFLDEIGNLPMHLQAKLLTVIQSKQIVRVGSNETREVDIRLICATNKDLDKMVEEGTFREDLLYRINTIRVELPPLRERKEDILLLAGIFLQRYSAKYGKQLSGFSAAAKQEMLSYHWPGNIRELLHTIEKATILCDGMEILPEDMNLKAARRQAFTPLDYSTIEQMERSMIEQALQRHRGNMSAVAEQLGITRQTLYNKLKKYEL